MFHSCGVLSLFASSISVSPSSVNSKLIFSKNSLFSFWMQYSGTVNQRPFCYHWPRGRYFTWSRSMKCFPLEFTSWEEWRRDESYLVFIPPDIGTLQHQHLTFSSTFTISFPKRGPLGFPLILKATLSLLLLLLLLLMLIIIATVFYFFKTKPKTLTDTEIGTISGVTHKY